MQSSIKSDMNILKSISAMKKDIKDNKKNYLAILKDNDRKLKDLESILEAFIFCRPDIAWVSQMTKLAVTLLRYCGKYDSFCCLINLIHSYHFISFFRNQISDVNYQISNPFHFHTHSNLRWNGE